MIQKIQKKLNISYARYLKNRIADKYKEGDEISRAENHSKRVKFLRKIIFRVIILMVVLIIVWPLTVRNLQGYKVNFLSEKENAEESTVSNGLEPKEKEVEDIPVMLKPRFYGSDDNGQPYSISADSGVSVSEKKVVLSNIEGNMNLKDNSRLEVSSAHGDYFLKEKEVSLIGDVRISIDRGYDFKTNTAYIMFKENMATGSEKVEITGIMGDIVSNGFTIKNSGDEIFFFGGVDLTSNPEEVKKNAK